MPDLDEDGDLECDCGMDDCPSCDRACWRCHGEGYGMVGLDWDSDDPINGPYDGESEWCSCCNGTGRAKDCTYW